MRLTMWGMVRWGFCEWDADVLLMFCSGLVEAAHER